jgi:heme oxygenase
MYVVEGSTLGGRYILRNIKSTLQLDENTGATYFNGYGADTSANWKQFIAELNAFEQRNDCGSEIIEGANFAFEAIECHMTEYNQL